MSNKVFPKEGDKKLKDTIKTLRAERRTLQKKIKFLEDELINVTKPVRQRMKAPTPLSDKEWREEFAKKFKDSLKRGNNE
tara:strand:- start:58978 stop:59217 length:240 start_codon:yes stop_codon:yes gene_type:complete